MQFYFLQVILVENIMWLPSFPFIKEERIKWLFLFFFTLDLGLLSKREEFPQEEENWVKHLNLLLLKREKKCLNLDCEGRFGGHQIIPRETMRDDLVAVRSSFYFPHNPSCQTTWWPLDRHFFFLTIHHVKQLGGHQVSKREKKMTQWPPSCPLQSSTA